MELNHTKTTTILGNEEEVLNQINIKESIKTGTMTFSKSHKIFKIEELNYNASTQYKTLKEYYSMYM